MMGLHKLSAGSGYTYLTRQTAAHDSTEVGAKELADYYSSKGESPGRWMGSGLGSLGGVTSGDVVTEAQMKALFGEGRHPNADAIFADKIDAGVAPTDALKASQLGQVFRVLDDESSEFVQETAQRYQAWLKDEGLSWNAKVPPEVRARIRTEVGVETFQREHGRVPDERELNTHIARSTRPQKQQVAGYDLTFSPVKSVSVLWALGDADTARAVSDAHDSAVRETMRWLEQEVIYTRRGRNGVRHVETNGLIAAAFVHRDSRSGEPDLHTHVAISNKVQAREDGKWLAVDGQVLYKATVAASERYNTLLEREMNARLGVRFSAREEGRGKRPVREIDGIPAEWNERFSSRRAMIEARAGELQGEFRATHGRAPTPKESLDLFQQATLETREAKHEPRSEEEQRIAWRAAIFEAEQGDVDRVEGILSNVITSGVRRSRRLDGREVEDLAAQIVRDVERQRARFQVDHLTAEAQRRVRSLELDPSVEQDTVVSVVAACQGGADVVRLDPVDPVSEPASVRLSDGSSMYERPRSRLFTTEAMLRCERDIIDASHRRSVHAVTDDIVALALLESVANGKSLNAAQTQLVTEMATQEKFLQLALAPAGSGKTTSMRVLASAWQDAYPQVEGASRAGGGVVGFAPTAVAAMELGASIGTRADTLAKLVFHLDHPEQNEPEWMRQIGAGTMLIVDEAGMASTQDLARLVEFARSRDAVVRLIGDDQQLASVSAGGVLRDIAADAGAITLSELVRFKDPAEAAATLALRDGQSKALGFYVDHDRVRVTADGDIEDAVYAAWKSVSDADEAALMLAYSNDTVRALNARARAERIQEGKVSTEREVILEGGLRASAGDVIVTRLNDRRLPVSLTDFVKNGDRWQVMEITEDGDVTARHEKLGNVITLPASYVGANVDLGYASTIHGAQGQTVHSSFVLARGEETRQLLYVGMSRGTDMNRVFVPMGTDGDPHGMLREDRINPRVATEILEGILARDGSQVSATSEQREQNDPRTWLKLAAERYSDAVLLSATRAISDERRDAITAEAERLAPGVSEAPAWETLLGNVALRDLNGRDGLEDLRSAVAARELGSARDLAAVLDWRLDPETERSGGPLPWLPALPSRLSSDAQHGAWLHERRELVVTCREDLNTIVAGWDDETVPEWARDIYIKHARLAGDLLAWRSAHDVPDDDTSVAGPAHPNARERRYQRKLEERYERLAGGTTRHGAAFVEALKASAPEVLNDVWWPVLAQRLDLALGARLPVHAHLCEAIASKPLPSDYAAAALWFRLERVLEPAIATSATSGSGATRLRPNWSGDLVEQLPEGVGMRVMTDAHWPSLVASVNRASDTTGLSGQDVITRALDLIGRDMLPSFEPSDDEHPRLEASALATILALRVADLTSPPAAEDIITEDDLLDSDVEAFLSQVAAQRDDHTPRDERAVPVAPADFDDAPALGDLDAPPEDEERLPFDTADIAALATPEVETGTSRARIVDLTAEAGRFYVAAYDGSASQDYLRGRFGTDLSDSTYFVGHAGSDRSALTRHLTEQHGAEADELIDAGLSKWRYGRLEDVFVNRALIGIHDHEGTLVGFNGRDLSGQHPAKYLNTPSTKVFTKGNTLFGLHEGRALATSTHPDVVGVEGPMDAIAATLAGNGEVIGVAGGTGGFTASQVDQLTAYAARTEAGTIWLAKDNDKAGRRALAKDTTAFHERGMTARAFPVMGGKDLADMWAETPDVMRAMLAMRDQNPVASRFVALDIAQEHDLDRADIPTRITALKQIAAVIAELPPQHWETEIDAATVLFTSRDDTDAYDHYARSLYGDVIARALKWDHETHEPAPGTNDLEAAQQLARLHDALTDHGQRPEPAPATKARENLQDVLADLRSRRGTKTTSKTARPPRIRRDDDERRDAPRQGGPSRR